VRLFCYLDVCAGGHFVRCVVWLPVDAATFAGVSR
jgi:hypothetical protein